MLSCVRARATSALTARSALQRRGLALQASMGWRARESERDRFQLACRVGRRRAWPRERPDERASKAERFSLPANTHTSQGQSHGVASHHDEERGCGRCTCRPLSVAAIDRCARRATAGVAQGSWRNVHVSTRGQRASCLTAATCGRSASAPRLPVIRRAHHLRWASSVPAAAARPPGAAGCCRPHRTERVAGGRPSGHARRRTSTPLWRRRRRRQGRARPTRCWQGRHCGRRGRRRARQVHLVSTSHNCARLFPVRRLSFPYHCGTPIAVRRPACATFVSSGSAQLVRDFRRPLPCRDLPSRA